MTAPAANELYKFSDIAFDVGLIFGSTTDQGLERAKRCLNRAAIIIAGHDRRWSWMRVEDSLLTVASEPEYSLPDDFRKEEMFWIQTSHRQKLDRISSRRVRELAPDQSIVTGIPRLYDFNGVDSSGSRIVTFYPTPSAADIEIFFRYSRFLVPILEDDASIRSRWGMPPNIIEVLTQKAAALAVQGVNSASYFAMNNAADAAIMEAYAADQAHPDAIYQAQMIGSDDYLGGDPILPPEYGRT